MLAGTVVFFFSWGTRNRAFRETAFEFGSSAADRLRMSPIIEGRHEIEDSPLNVERLNQERVLVTADSPIRTTASHFPDWHDFYCPGSQLSLRMGSAFGNSTRAVLATTTDQEIGCSTKSTSISTCRMTPPAWPLTTLQAVANRSQSLHTLALPKKR